MSHINSMSAFVVVLFFVVALICVIKVTKHARKNEDERRQAEIQRQVVVDQQLEALRGRRFVVFIREEDGKQSSFESRLIKSLLECGVVFPRLTEHDARKIAEGYAKPSDSDCAVIVGTVWCRKEECQTHCDYRVLCYAENTSESVEKLATMSIVGAGVKKWRSDYEGILASSIVQDVAAQLWRTRQVSE